MYFGVLKIEPIAFHMPTTWTLHSSATPLASLLMSEHFLKIKEYMVKKNC